MQNKVLPLAQAVAEVEEWLDKKKVPVKEREKKRDDIDVMIDSVMDGTLIMNVDGTISHELCFPIEDKSGDVVLNNLVYRLRVNVATINAAVKGSGMDLGLITRYGAALTDQPVEMINRLDTQDNKILRAIASFFI